MQDQLNAQLVKLASNNSLDFVEKDVQLDTTKNSFLSIKIGSIKPQGQTRLFKSKRCYVSLVVLTVLLASVAIYALLAKRQLVT